MKMQGEPTLLLAESHYAVRGWKPLLPKAEKSREKLAGLQGKAGLQDVDG